MSDSIFSYLASILITLICASLLFGMNIAPTISKTATFLA